MQPRVVPEGFCSAVPCEPSKPRTTAKCFPELAQLLTLCLLSRLPRRTSMDLETLNSGSASLREVRCRRYPLGRVVIGRHLVNEGRTMAWTLVNVEEFWVDVKSMLTTALLWVQRWVSLCLHNFKCWTNLSVTKEAVDAGSSRARATIWWQLGPLRITFAVIMRAEFEVMASGAVT